MAVHITTENGTILVDDDSITSWQKPYRTLIIKNAVMDPKTGPIKLPLSAQDSEVLRSLL